MWNGGWLWSQCSGIPLHVELSWGTPNYFQFLQWHQCPSRLLKCSWGLSGVPSRKSSLLMCLIGNMEYLWMQCRGIGPHLTARGKSHCFSRVALRTWGIFSSFSGDDSSKLVFVQRRQDSCLVTMDTSGISSRLGRAIRMLLKVRQETECSFLVATVILGFLSIIKKSQAFHLLKHWTLCDSRRVKGMWGLLSRSGGDLGLSPRSPQRIQTSLRLVRWKMSLHLSHCMEIQPSFESGHLSVFSTGGGNLGSLSHTYCWRKHLLRCLCKVCLLLQSKTGNQLSSQDDMGCTELSSSCCAEIGVGLDLKLVSQGISGVA